MKPASHRSEILHALKNGIDHLIYDIQSTISTQQLRYELQKGFSTNFASIPKQNLPLVSYMKYRYLQKRSQSVIL